VWKRTFPSDDSFGLSGLFRAEIPRKMIAATTNDPDLISNS
jgi:hypothetical protein